MECTRSLHCRDVIWAVRIREIQLNIVDDLQQVTIWNAGKQVRDSRLVANDDR